MASALCHNRVAHTFEVTRSLTRISQPRIAAQPRPQTARLWKYTVPCQGRPYKSAVRKKPPPTENTKGKEEAGMMERTWISQFIGEHESKIMQQASLYSVLVQAYKNKETHSWRWSLRYELIRCNKRDLQQVNYKKRKHCPTRCLTTPTLYFLSLTCRRHCNLNDQVSCCWN